MIRALAAWVALGGLLVLAERALVVAPPLPPLVVEVPSASSSSAVDQRVREALLLDTARRLGWGRSDPVVARVLQEAMSIALPAASPEERTEAALALGLDLTEPTVRARLRDRAERALAALDVEPDDATLEAWRAAHADRFRVPDRWSVDVVRGDAALRDRLRAGAMLPEGEPAAGGRRHELATSAQLAARYGDALAAAIATSPPGTWSGPTSTPSGTSLVRVDARVLGGPAPLADVRGAVAEDWRRAREAEVADARWTELRASRTIEVVRR